MITGYSALVNPEAVGYPLTAFVAVQLEHPRHRRRFLQRIGALREVVECHHITGEDDYLLKVRCRGSLDLDRLLTMGLKSLPGVARTRTPIVLATSKESMAVP